MRNDSFTQSTGSVTQDSNPRKLNFVSISQDPRDLFQQGEKILAQLGKSVDLSNAHLFGAESAPEVPAPILSELTGGVGNELQFTLLPPPSIYPKASELTAGAFQMSLTGPTGAYWDDAVFGNLSFDGGSRHAFWGPLGFTSQGKTFAELNTGHWEFDFVFTDETSASVTLTGAAFSALATAQSLGGAKTGFVDLSTLITPLANASGGKSIAGINIYKTTPFGVVGGFSLLGQFFMRDSNGTLRNILDGTGPSTFINLTEIDESRSNIVPGTPFTLAVSPQFYFKAWSMGNVVRIAPTQSAESSMLKVTTPFAAPNYASGTMQFFDNQSHALGGVFSLTAVGEQNSPVTDAPQEVARYCFYYVELLPPPADPITVDVPIAATDLIAYGTTAGVVGDQAGTIPNYGGAVLNGYAGYELLSWNISAPAQYASSGTPIDYNSALNRVDFIDSVAGAKYVGSVIELSNVPPGVLQVPAVPFILSDTVALTVGFSLYPNYVPPIYFPLLTTEPYEIRNRNQVAFRFACVPPQLARPGDFTSPKYTIQLYGSQGLSEGNETLWTRLPFNIVGFDGLIQHSTEQQISAYPFYDSLPDRWAGSAVVFDNQEYATPWNYVRFVILPFEAEVIDGYVLSITANAREL